MRIAISNIAWDVTEDDQVASLLRERGIDAVDIAPGKYFPEPARAADADIARVRAWWAERGIELTGMQALLFGTTGLNLFGTPQSQEAMLVHLRAVCRIGGGLGATRLVFGSPKNRDRGALDDATAEGIACDFFRRLGDVAAAAGVVVCLEPNPPAYNCNFMTTTAETAHIVRRVDHRAIRLQLDSGALAMSNEDPYTTIAAHGELIGHAHASEPGLKTLGSGDARHAEVAHALDRLTTVGLISIEMTASLEEPHLAAIARAVEVAERHYRQPVGQPLGQPLGQPPGKPQGQPTSSGEAAS